MFVEGINDKDLTLIIYKAGARLYPQYEVLFCGDIEEFQQHCAVLILPKLKKYDSSRGSISNYIYKTLPFVLGQWVAKHKEYKTMLFEINKSRLPDLIDDEAEDIMFEDTQQDVKQDLINKERDKVLKKLMVKYPMFCTKETEDLTFKKLGKQFGISERQAKYLWWKELIDIRNNYMDILKSLSEN